MLSSEFNGQVLRFVEEQRLIEIAHSETDEAFVSNLSAQIDERIDLIVRCMAERHSGYIEQLIRPNNTVPLYIHAKPNTDDSKLTQSPSRHEGFNLSKAQISRIFKNMEDNAVDIDADFVLAVGIEQGLDDDSTRYQWHPLKTSQEVFSNDAWLFVAHPQVISYSSETGLELIPGTTPARESPTTPVKIWERPIYRAERYHEHIQGLALAYRLQKTVDIRLATGKSAERHYSALKQEFIYPLSRLCERCNVSFAEAEYMLRLTLALHDVGKLNRPWQVWARDWQAWRDVHGYKSSIPLDSNDPLAHTDFNGDDVNERELKKSFKHAPRGNHAGESAEACLPILWQASNKSFWMAVVCGAIMRHHTPDVDRAGKFEIAEGVKSSFIKSLAIWGFEVEAETWFEALQKQFEGSQKALPGYAQAITPNRNDYDTALMYFLFVRALRLADQRSGRWLETYRNTKLDTP